MKIAQILSEFIPPAPVLRDAVYYHGTTRTVWAEHILQHGLVPGNVSGRSLGHLAPVSGAVYLTANLVYAIIYAIGGDMIGHRDNEYLIARAHGDLYGYVFVIPGDRLTAMVQPDEDSVGLAVSYAHRILTGGYAYQDEFYQNMARPENRAWVAELLRLAPYAMTPRQFKNTLDGLVTAQASGGKRFLKQMSASMKLNLIRAGAHIAHAGPVEASQCWRIDRRRNQELARDGSNFFQIAERIA